MHVLHVLLCARGSRCAGGWQRLPARMGQAVLLRNSGLPWKLRRDPELRIYVDHRGLWAVSAFYLVCCKRQVFSVPFCSAAFHQLSAYIQSSVCGKFHAEVEVLAVIPASSTSKTNHLSSLYRCRNSISESRRGGMQVHESRHHSICATKINCIARRPITHFQGRGAIKGCIKWRMLPGACIIVHQINTHMPSVRPGRPPNPKRRRPFKWLPAKWRRDALRSQLCTRTHPGQKNDE